MSDFERWVNTFADACDEAVDSPAVALFAVDDGDMALVLAAESAEESTAVLAQLDGIFAERRRSVAAMATRVQWSPTAHGQSSPAWALTVVGRELPAWFLVRRHRVDDQWWSLAVDQAPWFLLSTAGSLRAALDGKPMAPIKSVDEDGDLLRRPVDAPSPPLDDKGRL